MNIKQAILGDHINIKHGFAFKSKFFTNEGKYILLTPGNCFEKGGLKLKGDKEKYYSGDFPLEYLLNTDDLIVVMTDLVQTAPMLGGAFIIPEDDKYLHNQRLGLITIIDNNKLDKKYLYYCLNEHNYRGQIRGSATGTTVKHTAPERIKKCKVPLPPLPTQKRIADILSAYDDLIENNNRRITLLEQAARHLYKEWFVRFKFPGHEKVKIVDGVPEGWERRKLGEVAVCIGGGTPSTSKPEFWDNGDIEWFVPKDLTNNNSLILLGSGRKITPLGLQKSSAKMLPSNTILMTSRASIGFFGIFGKECCTNQGFISLIPNNEHLRYYILYNLMFKKDEIISNAGGTTFKEINKTTFRGMDILVPKKDLAELFNQFVADTLCQTKALVKENNNLTSARNLLLPKLINGDVQA